MHDDAGRQSSVSLRRLIGTIRGEYLDRTFFWNARNLERKLMDFSQHYKRDRVRRGLEGAISDPRPANTNQNIAWPGQLPLEFLLSRPVPPSRRRLTMNSPTT